MTTRRELCRAEEAGWQAFVQAWERIPEEAFDVLGYHPGWSVKDMVGHVGCWQAEAVQVFERIRVGTFQPERLDVDAMNAAFVEALHDQPVWVAKAECFSSRTRFVKEFALLPDVTLDAEEWFVESGARHYEEHLPRLIEWTQEIAERPSGTS